MQEFEKYPFDAEQENQPTKCNEAGKISKFRTYIGAVSVQLDMHTPHARPKAHGSG